ncbi:MAG: hypothetical protein ABFS22_03485 [Pseudomonadota bacterium]
MKITTETFFRAEEVGREQVNLPALLFNRCVLLLNRSMTKNVFVPVRTMQYQAVIDSDEVIFVDNQGYAVQDGKGGRLIVLAWQMPMHHSRDSLTEPVPIEVVYYVHDDHDIHRRLIGEFPKALGLYEDRLNENNHREKTAVILPFQD